MTKKHKSKKDTSGFNFIYIFLILIFAAGITFLTLSMFIPQNKDDSEDLSTAINETENKDDTGRGEATPEDEEEKIAEEKTPKQNEDESDAAPDSINASITMNEVSNGKYTLRITIYELLNSGTCDLRMENASGDTVHRSANIIATGANSSSCEGFDIRTDGIGKGTYDFTVALKSGSKSNTLKGIIKI